MATDSSILSRWLRRTAVAMCIGVAASAVYFAVSFIRPKVGAILMGDAYTYAFRIIFSRAFHTEGSVVNSQHIHFLALLMNALFYMAVFLVLVAWRDALRVARAAFPTKSMRRVVAFCLVQALGTFFAVIAIAPGTLVGFLLLLPGILLAFVTRQSMFPALLATWALNAVFWLAWFSALDVRERRGC